MRHVFCLLIALTATGEGRTALFTRAHELVALHNAVRARVGMPPLAWSNRLAAHSQEWANTLLARGQFVHRPHSTYGENLFEIDGAAASPAEVVNTWAAESRNYDYRSNRCRGTCGHYTQIVWSGTKEVGCAVARGGGREVWVCNYDPPGNWAGKRPY
jgi:pathogenesis-related protein 1